MTPFRRQASSIRSYRRTAALTLRWADPGDAERLETLAELDEAPVPAPPLLLGFVGEDLWAARSLSTGAQISDPFHPSAEVAGLLAERGRQLIVLEPRRRWLLRRPLALLPRRPRPESTFAVRARLGKEPG